MVVDGSDVRISPNFIAGEASETLNRCMASWSTRFGGCVVVKDWKTSFRHYSKKHAPTQDWSKTLFGDWLRKRQETNADDGTFFNNPMTLSPLTVARRRRSTTAPSPRTASPRCFARRFEDRLRYCHHTGSLVRMDRHTLEEGRDRPGVPVSAANWRASSPRMPSPAN